MKIALLGYGKMGKTIEKIAVKRGHDIIIKSSQQQDYNISEADVAIDFSVPNAAYNNIVHCFKHQVPVISGTTGWLTQYNDAIQLCDKYKGAFIYASNFSLGVNIFFELNKQLSKMMSQLKDYKVSIEEIHHTQKLDAPSGTAISLAEDIIAHREDLKGWHLNHETDNKLPISAKRIENVPGTHNILYKSDVDSITIGHEAHSRKGFALGAVIAAEWIQGKTGVFSMKDVLNIS
jgi:4-hydroxy-tetrahydrodipicolinate reductase